MPSLTISRTLDAPPPQVWQAWTDPVSLASWIWPEEHAATCDIDLRVGGRYRIESPTIGIAVSGDYAAVDPDKRLAFTWRWDGEDEESLVTVTLQAADKGTDLVVQHEGLATEESRANHEQGWRDCLDRLPDFLAPLV